MMKGTSWREQSQTNRRWICGSCLVNTNLQCFDPDLRQWIDVFVIAFNATTNLHTIKFQQDLRSVRLRHMRVREVPEMMDPEAHTDNTLTNTSIMEMRNGVRCYKGSEGIQDISKWNYHSLPQVVGDE